MTTWYKVMQDLVVAIDAVQDSWHTLSSYVSYVRANGGNHPSDLRKARRLTRKLERIYTKMEKLYEEATR